MKTGLGKIALGWAAGGLALGAVLAGGMTLHAQGLASHNTRAPVSFDAGSINFDDTKRIGYYKPGKSCLKVASQA